MRTLVASSAHRHNRIGLALLSILLFFATAMHSQNYLTATGRPSFTTASPVEQGFINLGNGNLHLEIPIASSPDRASRSFYGALIYDSRIWQVVNNAWQPNNVTGGMGGWRYATSVDAGSITETSTSTSCGPNQNVNTWQNFVWTDFQGTQRVFPIQTSQNQCTGVNVTSGDAFAEDSSGLHMYVANFTSATIFAKDGTQVYPNVKDSNGNYYSTDSNGNVVDTLNRTPVTKTTSGNTIKLAVANSQGTTSTYTVTTETISVNTLFAQSSVSEFTGTITVIQSIALPDGSTYSFNYDSGTAPGHYGSLTSVTLRTGGTVTYTYGNFQDAYGNVNQWVESRTSGGGTWNYTPQVISSCAQGTVGCQQSATVAQPSGDNEVYTFTLNNGAWNTETQLYTGTTALLQTVTTDYDFSNACPLACNGDSYIRPIRVTATDVVPGGSISKKTELSYDSIYYGNITAKKDWQYYTGSPAANPDRETDYAYLTSSSYVAKDILNRVTSATVKNAGGTQLSATNYSYDNTSLTSKTGITHHDDTNYGTGNTVRGNVTVAQQWVSGTASLTTTNTYDTTGQMTDSVDPANNKTTYSFADGYYTDNGSNPPNSYTPSAATNAYLTQVTYANSLHIKYRYYFYTGKTARYLDENDNSVYWHFMDPLDRPTTWFGLQASTNNAGWNLYNYTSVTQTDVYTGIIDATASTSCSICRHDVVYFDGLGRQTRKTLASDPDGATMSDTAYDVNSRVQSLTNPYRSTSDPTYGQDTFQYDGLDRDLTTTHSDGNAQHVYYGANVGGGGGATSQLCSTASYGVGYPVLYVDEAGNKRQNWISGFGQVIETDEPDSNNSLTLGTCYSYDSLNNLLQVSQGTQTRAYAYDGLSRKTSSTEPESGTTTLYYTTSAGALCSGKSENVCRRTDARNFTTTYAYDSIGRLTSKTYSDGKTPSVSYYYDQTTYNNLSITFGLGRRTGMSDGSGQTAWSYNAAGEVLTKRKTVTYNGTGVTKSVSYTYNLDYSLATIEYPYINSNTTVTYAYTHAQRAKSLKDTGRSINYATSATYAPQGDLAGVIFGNTSTFSGMSRTRSYNSRLQPVQIVDTSSNGNVQSLNYSYDLGSGVNNGSVASIADNLVPGRTQSFTYDNLSRVTLGQTTATSGSDCWGQTFAYDRFGNLLTVGAPAGYSGCTEPNPTSYTYDGNNHMTTSGVTYDAAGNMTKDVALRPYSYDAENRVLSANGNTYQYDGDGLRVAKTNLNEIDWFDEGGNLIAETSGSGGDTRQYMWFNGRMIARFEISTGVPSFYFGDALHSTRAMTDASGNVQDNIAYYPFGQEHTSTTGVFYKFTNKKRDSETQNDNAHLRMYESQIARFLTPDPGPCSAASPQSSNRYSYVTNNPTNLTDSSGGCLDNDPFCVDVFAPALDFYGAFGFRTGFRAITEFEPTPGQIAIARRNAAQPDNLVQGTQRKFWEPFRQGFNWALFALGRQSCKNFFGGKGAATLRATTYAFEDLGSNTNYGAQTNDIHDVFINSNSNGPYMDPPPNFLGVTGMPQIRGLILLHELGHQLSSITGFRDDRRNEKLNLEQSREIVRACF